MATNINSTQKLFDHTFGCDFIEGVPHHPGVYEFLCEAGHTIYVGKAKDLRNRIGQYRNTRIDEDNGKVRRMLKTAVKLKYQLCETDLEAQLLENSLIQKLKPRFNWSGTNYESYPCIGIKRICRGEWEFCSTRHPDVFREQGFRLFGSYRQKDLLTGCFAGLGLVFGLLGKRQMMPHTWYVGMPKRTEKLRIADLDGRWIALFEQFLLGTSTDFIANVATSLLDCPAAIHRREEVQQALDAMRQFYRKELAVSREIRRINRYDRDFIPQHLRDRMHIVYRASCDA